MSRNRIRVILPVRWPDGGIRTYIRYVYRRFDPDAYEFTLVGPAGGLAQVEADLPMHELRLVKVEPESSERFFFAVSQALQRSRYDLVHSHGLTAGIAALPLSGIRRIPHVLTGHDMFRDGQFVGMTGRVKRSMIGVALGGFTAVHFIGEAARSNWCSYFPHLTAKPQRLVTIRSGIEPEGFLRAAPDDIRGEIGAGSEVRLFGFLGRFMAPKGFPDLIRAVAAIRDRGFGPDRFRIVCFGWGGFIREDQQVIRERGLDAYFHFLGFREHVAGALKGLDAVVMPSRWETLSLLAMECLVAGVPVIGTTCPGLREVLQGSPARLVAPGDPSALATALLESIVLEGRADAAAYSREAARCFDVAHTASALDALYRRLGIPTASLDQHPPPDVTARY